MLTKVNFEMNSLIISNNIIYHTDSFHFVLQIIENDATKIVRTCCRMCDYYRPTRYTCDHNRRIATR